MESWPKNIQGRLEQWRGDGLERRLKIASGSGTRFTLDGRAVLSFASNDYLGLATHPALASAAKLAIDAYGTGAGASALISGHKREHEALESELAAFKRTDAALVFSSGYQAALAALTAVAGEADTVVIDRLAHASLIDGAKLSDARVRVFKHNDTADLKRMLEKESGRRCVIVAESLYSMDGDVAPLGELIDISARADALLVIDEAHATGVLGSTGRGALEEFTTPTLPEHIIAMGTLSKALGSQGGYICAAKEFIQLILHAGRAYMFSTALAPASAAAARAALKLVDQQPQRRGDLAARSARIRDGLSKKGFEMVAGESTTPIIPVIAGDEARATAWAMQLLEAGIYVPAIRYPTVKRGRARLRISVSAAHTDADCDALLAAMATLKS